MKVQTKINLTHTQQSKKPPSYVYHTRAVVLNCQLTALFYFAALSSAIISPKALTRSDATFGPKAMDS